MSIKAANQDSKPQTLVASLILPSHETSTSVSGSDSELEIDLCRVPTSVMKSEVILVESPIVTQPTGVDGLQ